MKTAIMAFHDYLIQVYKSQLIIRDQLKVPLKLRLFSHVKDLTKFKLSKNLSDSEKVCGYRWINLI